MLSAVGVWDVVCFAVVVKVSVVSVSVCLLVCFTEVVVIVSFPTYIVLGS